MVHLVCLNRGQVSSRCPPFGDAGQTGLGREGAHEDPLELTETRYVATDW
jgi:acyl-CoA reductase-like NAD-dependent aldehyde dehydrogenase